MFFEILSCQNWKCACSRATQKYARRITNRISYINSSAGNQTLVQVNGPTRLILQTFPYSSVPSDNNKSTCTNKEVQLTIYLPNSKLYLSWTIGHRFCRTRARCSAAGQGWARVLLLKKLLWKTLAHPRTATGNWTNDATTCRNRTAYATEITRANARQNFQDGVSNPISTAKVRSVQHFSTRKLRDWSFTEENESKINKLLFLYIFLAFCKSVTFLPLVLLLLAGMVT